MRARCIDKICVTGDAVAPSAAPDSRKFCRLVVSEKRCLQAEGGVLQKQRPHLCLL